MPDRDDSMPQLRPVPLLAALGRNQVRYVAVGSYSAIAQGVELPMTELDIVPATDDENVERLVACLGELGAKETTEDEPKSIAELRSSPRSLVDTAFRMFSTKYGELDIVLRPAGFPRGYEDLVENAVIATIQDETDSSLVVEVPLADVRDVYESKRRAGRPKDVRALPFFKGIHPEDMKETVRARSRDDVARREGPRSPE